MKININFVNFRFITHLQGDYYHRNVVRTILDFDPSLFIASTLKLVGLLVPPSAFFFHPFSASVRGKNINC